MGRIKALALLAAALVVTVLKLLLGLRRQGLARFHRNYDADGLASLSAEERVRMRGFGGCIACGLCDRGEAPRMVAAQGKYPGVMSLMLASSRSMPDFQAAARGFAWVSEDLLREKEAICPGAVPMVQIKRFVTAKASVARISTPPPGSADETHGLGART